MASIKGFSLKKIVSFRGHEREQLCQGDIYYQGRCVGFYSEDFYGGEAHVEFDVPGIDVVAEKCCRQYFSEHPDPTFEKFGILPDLSYFFYELSFLADKESKFKRYSKRYPNMVALVFYSERDHAGREQQYIQCCMSESSVNNIMQEKTKRNIETYRNLTNFVL